MLNLDPPPGFQGLDLHKPMHFYQRNMPHWRQDGATYFVTYRLGDSLPQSKLNELRTAKEAFLLQHGPQLSKDATERLAKQQMTRIEKWLDQSLGACHLKLGPCAQETASSLHFFDNDRWDLDCFVVMPNHVHCIAKPRSPQNYPLENVLQSVKRHSARQINQLVGLDGNLWQDESFDRIIRDAEHLYRAIQYIGRNPRLAKLRVGEYLLWIRPDWELLGWGFREN